MYRTIGSKKSFLSGNLDPKSELLLMHLELTVPIRVLELERRGGPDEADKEKARAEMERLLGPAGDTLFWRDAGKPGDAARGAAAVTEMIAILSFAPGGVRAFGHEWVSGEGNEGIRGGDTKGRPSQAE